MNKDMKMLLDFCVKNDEKIPEIFNKKSKTELIELFEQIVDDDPWIYIPAIKILIQKLYSDDERFVKILCKLIEDTVNDGAFYLISNPIYEIGLKNPGKTLSIVNKMINMGKQGLCTGIIISPLLGQGIVDFDIIQDLKSDKTVLQLQSLIGIREVFIREDKKASKIFIPKLIEFSDKINHENIGFLMDCFIKALTIDEKSINSVIKKEMDKRGAIAASIYLRQRKYRGKFHIALTKKSLKIIESEEPDSHLIDDALAQIYEIDNDFVIEKLRNKLQNNGRIDINHSLVPQIKRINPQPLIKMLEEEIDNGNPIMSRMGDTILRDLFLSQKEWLEWCKKWKNDERKETVILRSLSILLTNFRNYEDSSIRDEAIILVKEFAEKEGLDYDKETKHINFGKDNHEGAKNKEDTIKALFVLKRIRFPYRQVDIEILKSNLKRYPFIDKAINGKWLIKSAKSKSPHLLAYIYGQKIEYGKMEELSRDFDSENDESRKLSISILYNSIKQRELSQLYWEKVFKILDDHNLKISRDKIRDTSNAESFLTEAEVIARLVPHFKVEIEPDVEELRPNNLDLLIEFKGQKCLIEIAQASESIELEVAGDVISLPGGKIKKILLSKFRKQLKMGKVDLKVPVIIVINLMNGLNEHDAYDSIYGEFQLQFKKRKNTQEIVEEGFLRKNNSFYDENGSNVVTAIATYKRNYAKDDPLIGELHEHPRNTPKNPISREFRIKLRDALFGNSECSNWQSLMKIEGIDENLAKKLHANGIEDLNKLAITKELEIGVLDESKLHEYQKEARRIISAITTNSIRFLKGMNDDTYDLLTENGIYLIDELIKDDTPAGINKEILQTLLEDAKRIKSDD